MMTDFVDIDVRQELLDGRASFASFSEYIQFSSCASPGNSSFFVPTSNSRMTLVLFICLSRILTISRN